MKASIQQRDADEPKALRQQALDEIRKSYPPILTTAHVAELMHCTIGDVRDKVHSGELPAVRWVSSSASSERKYSLLWRRY